MKEKRYKYVEDLVEDYLQLLDEKIELPLTLAAAREKQISLLDDVNGDVVRKSEADDLFKVYLQIQKVEDRQAELAAELEEVEAVLKGFLQFLEGNELGYERKDEGEKQKITYLFWLTDGRIVSNR